MDDDHEQEHWIPLVLHVETVAHYEQRAQAAGRTWDEQICYEIEVNYGARAPDPGDREATQRRELFRRMRGGSLLQG